MVKPKVSANATPVMGTCSVPSITMKPTTFANSAFLMATCDESQRAAPPTTLINISSDSDDGDPQDIKKRRPCRQKTRSRPHHPPPRPYHQIFISSDSDDASATKPLMSLSSYHATTHFANLTIPNDDSDEAENKESKVVPVFNVETLQEAKFKGLKSSSIGVGDEHATNVVADDSDEAENKESKEVKSSSIGIGDEHATKVVANNMEAIIRAFPNIMLISKNEKNLPVADYVQKVMYQPASCMVGGKKNCGHKDENPSLTFQQPQEGKCEVVLFFCSRNTQACICHRKNCYDANPLDVVVDLESNEGGPQLVKVRPQHTEPTTSDFTRIGNVEGSMEKMAVDALLEMSCSTLSIADDFGDKKMESHAKAAGPSQESSLSEHMHGQGLEKAMSKDQHAPSSHKVATSIAYNTRSKAKRNVSFVIP